MSFQIEPEPQSIAGSDLINQVVREMRKAFAQEKQKNRLTQQSIAKRLGLRHRSIVNKWLSGRENLGLRTIGELAWAMNRRAVITFVDSDEVGGNFFDAKEDLSGRNQYEEVLGDATSAADAWKGVKQQINPSELMLENA